MRTKFAIAVMMLALAFTAQAGLEDAATSLNTAIQEVTLKTVLPKLAETLQMDAAVLDKALSDTKLKLSDVGLAKYVAEKTGKPLATYLTAETAADWPSLLQKTGIKTTDAADYLDNLESEVAFAMLDFKAQKVKVAGR